MDEPYVTECFCPQHDIVRALMVRLAGDSAAAREYHPCADVYVADIIISMLARERINEYMTVLRDPATFIGLLPRDCLGMILPRLSSDGMFAEYHHSFSGDAKYGYIAYDVSIRFKNDRRVDLLHCRNGECYHLTRRFLDTGGCVEYPVVRGYVHGMYETLQRGVVQYRSYDFMNIILAVEFASGNVTCFNVFKRDLKRETTGTFTKELRRWCFTKLM